MSNSAVETESSYDILENAEGDLLLCLKTKSGHPEKPQILYSGDDHALFYRTQSQVIMLDFIHPNARPLLKAATSVLVAEFSDADPETQQSGIVREYNATVRNVSQLPSVSEF